uniref:Uncharacterized protein n=1 Tax=Cucumis melo TaxID=3656 RepID=A0A9I9DLY5_CUCME
MADEKGSSSGCGGFDGRRTKVTVAALTRTKVIVAALTNGGRLSSDISMERKEAGAAAAVWFRRRRR